MAVTVRVEGLNNLLAGLGRMWEADGAKLQEAIEFCVNEIGDLSQHYVPVDTRALQMSGKKHIDGTGFKTRGRIAYSEEYAVIVHENLQAHHAPPTCAKFLERAAREKKQACEKKILTLMRA